MQNPRDRHVFGYRNAVYGNESTECIRVVESELDLDERMTAELMLKYYDEHRALGDKRYREGLKPSEVGREAELTALMDALQKNCRHRIFYDQPGFMYDNRYCACCGTSKGLV